MVGSPQIDDTVSLTSDLPELWLPRGSRGIVRSIWFSPEAVYEVEFDGLGLDYRTRALILQEQIELSQGAQAEAVEPMA